MPKWRTYWPRVTEPRVQFLVSSPISAEARASPLSPFPHPYHAHENSSPAGLVELTLVPSAEPRIRHIGDRRSVIAAAVAVAALVLGVPEPGKTSRTCPDLGSVLSLAAAARYSPDPQCLSRRLSLSLGLQGTTVAAGPGLLLDAEKTNVVLEILIIERVSVENWSAFGELKIKTKTLPQADFLMHNSWS